MDKDEKFMPVSLFGFCKIPTEKYVEFGNECNKRHVGYELSCNFTNVDSSEWAGVVVERPAVIHDLVERLDGYFVEIDFKD